MTSQTVESMNADSALTDVAIIGAGPVGLFAVFQCGMLGLKSVVIDSLPEIGGQCTALYPDKPIYDIPAYPNISGADLISQLEQQCQPFHPQFYLDQTVIGVSRQADGAWQIKTSKAQTIKARSVIVAGGAGCFGPNKPPLEGLDACENKSVFYMVRNVSQFEGKNIVIAGGGDSAIDWALMLSEIAASVKLVHRRDRFRATPDSVSKVKKLAETGNVIEICTPYQLSGIHHENGYISEVMVRSIEDESEKSLKADYLLPFYGLAPNLGPINEWGLDCDHGQIPVSSDTCMTIQTGLYAVGDIASYPKKLKLILTGFSECAMAAHAIYHYLNPDKPLHFEHSTSKGVQEL